MKMTVMASNPEMRGMVEMKNGIVFACPGGEELALHMVKPMWLSDGAGFPLVVFIQGSAWTQPNQYWEIPQLSMLARRGFVVATVTHRSCMTAAAPAFLKDVKTAVRFLRANAKEFDIDPTRVCAWGTSSGGNTALLLGLTGDDPAYEADDWQGVSSAVQAVVECFGPTDVRRMLDVQFADADDSLIDILLKLGGSPKRAEAGPNLDTISPMRFVRPGLALPPFMILHGDADPLVLYRDSEEFAEKMDDCGYDVEMVRVTGAPHEGAFWSLQLLETVFDFIERKLTKNMRSEN